MQWDLDCREQSYCISAIHGGQKEDDCRDAGGRATQGAVAEVELRQEQQPRATQATGRDAGSRATQERLPKQLPKRNPASYTVAGSDTSQIDVRLKRAFPLMSFQR